MKLSSKQVAVMRKIVKEQAPECRVTVSEKDENGAGHIMRQGGKVKRFYIVNREGNFGTMELDDEAKPIYYETISGDTWHKNHTSKYNAIKVALHEYGHIIQFNRGMMEKCSYAMNEIITEFVAMKLTKKYFPQTWDEGQELGSKYYISIYFQGFEEYMPKYKRLTINEEKNFKQLCDEYVKAIYSEVEKLALALLNSRN